MLLRCAAVQLLAHIPVESQDWTCKEEQPTLVGLVLSSTFLEDQALTGRARSPRLSRP
jgi:hypothetical protein